MSGRDTPWGAIYKGDDRAHVRSLHGFSLSVRRERGPWGGPSARRYQESWRWVGYIVGDGIPGDRAPDCVEWTLRDAKKELESAANGWLAFVERAS